MDQKIILNFKGNITKYGILKLYANKENQELVNLYKTHIEKHNKSILTDPFPNSGFDIFVPSSTVFNKMNTNQQINHEIKCEMVLHDITNQTYENSAYYIYPRSSMSKTELILSNHTGIIDSGYRGFLIGAFKWLKPNDSDTNNYVVEQFTRLLQICIPTLHPIFVIMVEEEYSLTETIRGSGGFGSTG